MDPGLTNLCVKIPKPMRKQIQDRQDAKGWTVDVYMNWMIETFFRMEESGMNMEQTEKIETRTFSFQVPKDMIAPFKEYLRRRNLKQKEFFLDCIQRALAEDVQPETAE